MRRNYFGNDVEDEVDIPRLRVAAGNMRRQAIGHRDDLNHIAKIELTLTRPVCESLSDEPHDFRGRPRVRADPPLHDLHVALHPGALRHLDFDLPVDSQRIEADAANLLSLPQRRKKIESAERVLQLILVVQEGVPARPPVRLLCLEFHWWFSRSTRPLKALPTIRTASRVSTRMPDFGSHGCRRKF